MAIDPAVIGKVLPSHEALAERGRLRFFAKAIGETNPIYSDVEAAKAAGHRDLPVPPTFLFCLDMEKPDPFLLLRELDIDVRHILHGEQAFEYHSPAYAGDTLAYTSTVTDTYSKKGGALDFLVRNTEVTRDGELIARLTNTLVVRNPKAQK
ncbi:MaoC family dehydratase N-terminal domain-containing protein [Rhodococcus sp. OK302]|uniref:MaoC family dehydratase N-terminal domain-containing protein n=1 Tax=Rhodococcus sp. OK302 TaxID=1882769 RepID=UPI000B93DEEC|nr:MaoC family dehydratase N-terminal domain-containing protein [Rhodococcus sp. OK302]OYD66657.1 acyl dehydratase [Rhodococcus sp. OK302]